ncbi:hypothetical protein [Frigoribacterium sp. PhB118]|uniref:hypothetical protein n=1 Tax=Frigoribacterium sp. PhB118 TaxID=2485175 RepID=UPI000F494FFB|nr:hypothetical protein [Frigoribacterium sp. PhB118]
MVVRSSLIPTATPTTNDLDDHPDGTDDLDDTGDRGVPRPGVEIAERESEDDAPYASDKPRVGHKRDVERMQAIDSR